MRRSLPAATVVVVGLLLLVNFIVINPLLGGVAEAVLLLVVLLAAGAAVLGGVTLALRHASDLLRSRGDRAGSAILLAGMVAVLGAGLYPGSQGAADPAARWLVAALLAPLLASLFAMLFVFLLSSMRRGMLLRSRQMTVVLTSTALVVVLLLPLGGRVGELLAMAATWAMDVPIGGVFRGLLIGVAVVTAVHAARIVLAVDGADD